MCFRPPSVDAESTIICPKCGASNSLDATNCKKCGASLDGVSEDAPPMPSPQAPAIASAVIPALDNLPRLSVDFPELPGASAIRTNLIGTSINDAALWRFLKKSVVARKDSIDCWYSSPVTALIQDPDTKAIVGVEIEHEGKKLNIAARGGVIMAPGGYENNVSLIQQTIDAPKGLPVGTLYNEGDGVRMAQAVGAKLWHMNAWKSGGVGLAPEEDRMRSIGDSIEFFTTGSVVLIGGDAKRYIAEDLEQRHGRVLVGGTWVVPPRPDTNVFVFDEAQRQAMAEGSLAKPFPNWSGDLAAEVESGKVVKSDTLWGIADAFSLDAAALSATIEAFNGAAKSGADPLGRKAEAMRAFGEGPYYAVRVFPSVVSTNGGPERTARAEVLDCDDAPIPHLYAAGEFGSIMARNAQGGGNLSECIVFGKIAGEEAAAHKDDAFDIASDGLACGPGSGEVSVYDEKPDAEGLALGESMGVGEGLGGPLWVKVSSEGGAVRSVEVLRQSEYADIGGAALETLAKRMAEAGTFEVDGVAGATVTSMGLKEAVENALVGGE
ncbi:FAD-binding protein [Raoultibacter phocaeensis]|uniref:FAD-binding protein n=1 Tax=Raoultibacter phocaeensis TaxID=2479841 RepID=UPI001119D66C|nr:FAD-binding protein [Raoultibacter phocaeensis]